jgi:murein DD-endopeptidase MepM/ murein hydrolase activator NlpD
MAVDYRAIAREKASKYGLLPEVFERQIQAESGFNPAAVSEAGARGIAQIMPSTARGWGVNPDDPVAALDSAAKNMAAYIKTYGGLGTSDPVKVRSAYEKALQAYNAGPGSVGRYLPKETQSYIAKIVGPDKFSFTNALAQGVAAPTGAVVAPTSEAVAPISIPRFDFKSALSGIIQDFTAKQRVPSQIDTTADQYLALAGQIEEAGTPEAISLAEQYRAKALEASANVATPSADTGAVLQQILGAKVQEKIYNDEIANLESIINKSRGAADNKVDTGAKVTPGKGLAIPGVTITSAKDTSGEPGFDFVISGGRGASFNTPFQAKVLKVVGNQNWETNLEKGPGKRGYGNHVELRGVDPATGKEFDVLLAHFDKINPELKPGTVITPGTFIGTQGRTGSTTGAHVSADFYDPGRNTTSRDVLDIGFKIRDRLAKGQPVF